MSRFVCFIAAFFCMLFSSCQWSICEHGSIEEQKDCLKNLPFENLNFSALMGERKVYYSITTSPKRLKTLRHTLDTLDFSIPEKVFIVLPLKYKNKEDYEYEDIFKISKYHSKIVILRPQIDLGPAMKFLPAAEELQKDISSAQAFLMSLDDDIGYPRGLPAQLVKYAVLEQAVVAGSGQNAYFWDISGFPSGRNNCRKAILSKCDVIEGFHGIVYPVELVNTETIKKIVAKPECKLSDDIAISYALAKSGVKYRVLKNEYTRNLLPFAHGNEADGLHVNSLFFLDGNMDKYRRCMRAILRDHSI